MNSQNDNVLRSYSAFGALLVLMLAGCATNSSKEEARSLNWSSPEYVAESVTPSPPIAPAPSTIPVDAAASRRMAPTTAPSASPAPSAETWIALNRWSQNSGYGNLTRLPSSSPQPSFALTTTNGILLVRPGSQVAHWRGLEFPLGFAPRLIDGQPYVHSLDLRKSLQPLLEHIPTSGFGHPPVIVIDPGHGGRDAGTHSISGNLAEKDLTLDWARRVQSVLRQNGWQVFLTRTGDEDLTLPDRIARAEEHKADLFLSLHFNSAAPNEVETGFETYLLTPTGMPSTLTRGFEDDPGRIFPNNNFDTQNLHLAVQVHRALLQINGTHDRGVRHARFLGVLRGQQRPAILIEGGYLSNPHEARRIADPEYRQKMAEAVASVLAEQVSGSGTQRADGGGAGMSALTQSVSSP